jgi:hypothetical protein
MICAGAYILNCSDRMKCNMCPNLLVVGDGDVAPMSVDERIAEEECGGASERTIGGNVPCSNRHRGRDLPFQDR